MAEDYLKYTSGVDDPYAMNPFASEITPAPAETPFEMELPFRFTQFAINPASAATAGTIGRTAVARSPFTSGKEARELSMLRERIAGLSGVDPGEAPIMPTYTAPVVDQSSLQLEDTQFSTADLGIQSGIQQDLRWGLPVKEYQVPTRLLEDYKGRNPLDLAIRYSNKQDLFNPTGGSREKIDYGKYANSPMTSVTGFDVEQLVGSEQWNSILNAKSLEQGAQDRFFYNLSILPTDINPNLESKEHLASLATRDFTSPNRSMVANPEVLAAAAEMGYDISGLSAGNPNYTAAYNAYRESGGNAPETVLDPNYTFNPNDVAELLRTDPTTGGLRGFLQNWAPLVIQAGAAAVIGSALGAAAGPALGLSSGAAGGAAAGGETAASGLAGLAGMSQGAAATGVNLVGNAALSVGTRAALEQAGIPLDSPLAQMIAQIGGAALGGAVQSGGNGVSADTMKAEQLATAEQFGMSPEEYAQKILGTRSIDEFVNNQMTTLPGYIESGQPLYNITNEGVTQVSPDVFMRGAGGTTTGFNSTKFGLEGLQSGLQTYQAMTGQPTGGGLRIQDPSLYDPAGAYDVNYLNDMMQYEQEMAAYQSAMDEFNLRQMLQSEYETKQSDYARKMQDYSTYKTLRAKQAGITSNINQSIAENPYYDVIENYTGIQSQFVQ